jgi:hypothetical protein
MSETIGNVPARIGVNDLKVVCFNTLLPLFLKWTRSLSSLTIEEVELRYKNWLELIPRSPDIDAIFGHFFRTKGRNSSKKFSPGQGIDLVLAISHKKYELAVTHASSEFDCVSSHILIYWSIFSERHSG